MINSIKSRFILVLSLSFLFGFLKGQDYTLQGQYKRMDGFVDVYQSQIENNFLLGNYNKIIYGLNIPEELKSSYLQWFKTKNADKIGHGFDSTECNLPIMAYSNNQALICNGTFKVWFSKGDSTYYDFVRFKEFILELDKDNILRPGDFIPHKSPTIPEATLFESDFNIEIQPGTDLISVSAELSVFPENTNGTGFVSLFFRYPVEISEISCDGTRLEGEHYFIKTNGSIAHQCILNLGKIESKQTKTIKLKYKLDYENHSLSRKQLGISANYGYIVMEAGWYPWLKNSFETIPARISVTVPAGFMALAPGDLVETAKNVNGRTKYTYDSREETWPFIIWGDYTQESISLHELRSEIYLKKNSIAHSETIDSVFRAALGVLGDIFPKPNFKSHRIIEVDRRGGYGPTRNLLIESSYLNNRAIYSSETIELLSHELTHSWVNSLCPPGGSMSSFLSEGLATFMGTFVVERLAGEYEAYKLWSRNYNEYKKLGSKAISPSEISDEIMFTNNDIYRGVIYFKGAYFFKMLFEFSGAENFSRIFIELFENNKEFTLCKLRDISKDVNGKDYPELFDTFINTTMGPKDDWLLSYANSYLSDNDKRLIVNLSDSAFSCLESNNPDHIVNLFSNNTDLVPERIIRQIENAAENWSFNISKLEKGNFFIVDKAHVQFICMIVLKDSETEKEIMVTTELINSGGWKLINIRFE